MTYESFSVDIQDRVAHIVLTRLQEAMLAARQKRPGEFVDLPKKRSAG